MENFIRIYKNAYDVEYCKQLIDYFDVVNNAGFGRTREELEGILKHFKDDVSIGIPESCLMHSSLRVSNISITKNFFDLFFSTFYKQYALEFSILKHVAKHSIYNIKIQKTNPGGGYHLWHCENMDKNFSNRLCAFNLYLNTVEEGGETEFLYYGLRVKPEQGTLVIWPAGFTHAHRGNPPLKETKYLLTGWVEME